MAKVLKLRKVHSDIAAKPQLKTLNSRNHETTLTDIAAKRGLCLMPDIYEDDNPHFAWLEFDYPISFPCFLCTHADCNSLVTEFVQEIRQLY